MKAIEIKAILWILGLFTLGFIHHQFFNLLKKPPSSEAFSALSPLDLSLGDSLAPKFLLGTEKPIGNEFEILKKNSKEQNSKEKTARPQVLTRIEEFNAKKHQAENLHENLSETTQKVAINQVGSKELTQIKGIGPKIAEKIIKYRMAHGPYRSGADLLKVKGIGKAKLKTMLMRITFE